MKKPQRCTLTICDAPRKRITLKLRFTPDVKSKGKASPAVAIALYALKVIVEEITRLNREADARKAKP